jgi:N-methylhydantoinase B/oxoprolinase/acetone carboxylase alpha subunit
MHPVKNGGITRLPDLMLGDMEAQIAAARISAQRFLELIER